MEKSADDEGQQDQDDDDYHDIAYDIGFLKIVRGVAGLAVVNKGTTNIVVIKVCICSVVVPVYITSGTVSQALEAIVSTQSGGRVANITHRTTKTLALEQP